MKKVLVITRHAIANYGSILQAIATQRAVEGLGFECKIIDYIRNDEFKSNGLITAGKQKTYVKKFPPMLAAYYLARLSEDKSACNKFERMRQKWLPMTELYHDLSNPPEADIYMTGSDQVWGPLMNFQYDWNYFLDFVKGSKKKVAYAASFGKMEIEERNLAKMLQCFKEYDSITVRENQAVSFLNDNNIPSTQVLDPTLLFTGDEWRTMLSAKEREDKGKYVLVYQIHKNERLSSYAAKFAQRVGLPLKRLAVMRHQKSWGGDFIETPDIQEFLEYFDNAAYVVTDSFHGTAFSINLNTPFVTLMPETGTSARNISLLELTKLTSLIARDENDFSVLESDIDFTEANHTLEKERIKSKEELLRILSN
ncbi:polysaccharide pyruvyl transferase family protein [Butyrivibrio sp. AD3002]|uniref:polysaccharide pyruvyl transferase family protein n=1 Tax=Butyrivibrio sp. AD3002 TaxID=1280670 RepID=UPI0003B6D488|nr:polysaccharide pyruvyl transferase family protein [Butyrivibrio sp. AD3002]